MPEVDLQLYRLITVSGADTIEFLQGQLTQDVTLLTQHSQLPAAWCNPKGRVIATIQLIAHNETIGLLVAQDIADAVLAKLTMYRLRSKVEFDVDDEKWRQLVDPSFVEPAQLIQAGIPTIDSSNSEKYTPHMLNLDKLGAVNFTKGCYTGQEVVARTENLGKSKRRVMRYRANESGLKVGDKLTKDGRHVGEIVNAAEQELLAVAPVDVHHVVLQCNGNDATPMTLPYTI